MNTHITHERYPENILRKYRYQILKWLWRDFNGELRSDTVLSVLRSILPHDVFVNQHICLSNRKHSPEVGTAGTYQRFPSAALRLLQSNCWRFFEKNGVHRAWPSAHKIPSTILKSKNTESIMSLWRKIFLGCLWEREASLQFEMCFYAWQQLSCLFPICFEQFCATD